MKNIPGSLQHLFATANKTHIIWCAGMLIIMLILVILHRRWRDDRQRLRVWRGLCAVPIVVAGVHWLIYVCGTEMFFEGYLALYIIGALALIPIPFAGRKYGYRISAAISGTVAVLCAFMFCFTSPNYFNHTRESYTESFRSLVADMDKHYVLKEWKEVDFSALESKYLPAVEEAERKQDPAKFANAISDFCCELHDGHVSCLPLKVPNMVIDRHEYGLAMVQLDSGEVIAVCTVEEVNALGIEDGTVITKWNGKPISQAAAEAVENYDIPVKSNADRLGATVLSGIGGDSVEVTFLDKSNKEKTVTLTDLGERHTFIEAIEAFSQLPANITSLEKFRESNFSTKMLNDRCGYLVLNSEGTDNQIQDILGYLTGDHKWAREMFREKLRALKEQGMECLVIDLRNNEGGFDEIGCALCDLLTDEEWYGQGHGIRKNGGYCCVSDHRIHGDGEFADLKVVALTNYTCASAGDGTALYLSRLPNVSLAGITDPSGCNQETGGVCALSGELVYVSFPTGLILDETGVPNIDIRSDRISRNPVEVRIPLDHDAAMKIFRDKVDYELEWAINYVENER